MTVAVSSCITGTSNANADSEDEQQLQQAMTENAELQEPLDEQHELSAAHSLSTSQPTAPAAADTGSAASSQSDSADVLLVAEAACEGETDTRQTEAQPAVDVQDHIADAAARRASLTGQEGTIGRDKSSSSGGGGGGGIIVEAARGQSLPKQSKTSSLLKEGRHSKRSSTDESHAAANSRSCSTPSSSSVASMARTEGTEEVSQLEHVPHAQPVAAAAGSNTAAASSRAYAVDSSNRRDQQLDNSISSSSTSRQKSNSDAQSVAEAAAAATRAMASLGVGRSRTVSASGSAAIVSAAATAAATAAIMGLGRSSSTRTTDAAGGASSFDSSQQHQLEALETNADKLSRPHNLPQTAATAAADATTGSKQPSNAVVAASVFAGTCKTGTLSAVQLLQQACASESVRSSSSGTAVPSAADQIARLLPPHLLFAKPSNAPPSTTSIALGFAATSQATAQQQQQRQHAPSAAAADPSQPLMTIAHQPQQQQQRQPQMQPTGPPSSYGCPWQQQYSVVHPEAAQQYPSHTQLSEPSLPTADMQPAFYQPKVLHELHRPFGPALASELPHFPQQQQQYWQQSCSHHPGLLHQHPATSQQWDAPQHSQQQQYRPRDVSLAHSQHSTSISRHTTAVAAGPVAAPAAITDTNSGSHVALVHTSQPPIMPPATTASVQPHVSHSMTWDPLVPTSLTLTTVHPSPATLTFPGALSSTQHPHQQHVQRQHISPTSTQAVSQQHYRQPMQPWHPPVSVALPASASLAAPAVTFSNHNKAYTLQGNTASAEVALRQLRCLQEKYENMTCCVVCMDQPRSVLLLPCKHLALCEACSKELQSSGGTGECPVCRVPVAQYIEGVYMT